MPLQMASDPLGSKCLTCVWGPRYLPSQGNFDASSTALADIKGAAEHYLPTKGERAELAHTGETSQAWAATLRRTRHIGDFTLFWTGVYPEALDRLRSVMCKDHFIDYCQQGKRSYYIASTFEDELYREEAPVLRRLSDEFELCAFGLNQVRQEWERLQPGKANQGKQRLLD